MSFEQAGEHQGSRLLFFGIVSIGLFGSFIRGEQNSLINVVILVELMPEKHTLENFMEVSFLLEELKGRKVEVVTPEGLSPHIEPKILKDGSMFIPHNIPNN